MKYVFGAALCCLSLSMADVVSAQALTGAEAEAALAGMTFNTKDFGGEGTITWAADGTISVDVTKPDGSKVVDTGTYRFDGTGYCSTWTTLRTTEKCFTLMRTGEKTINIMNLDGTLDSELTMQ
jgi:FlaG/FlaF family flagellin (archaellin)